MTKYKRIAKSEGWYICYFVHDEKVVEVIFSAKDGDLAGWCQKLLFWNAG